MAGSTRAGVLSCVLILFAAGGCETASGPHGPPGDLLDRAVTDYEAGRYETAGGRAGEAMRSATGPQREDAAYLAGLSSYRVGRVDEAERRFMIASASSRPETAGKAAAMLGIIRLDQNRPREAAALFEKAEGLLAGPEAIRAAEHARLARRLAGTPAVAGGFDYAADAPSTSPSGLFALQVGAFRDAAGADRAAQSAQEIADRAGLGAVRIVASADERGGRLYLVQFGRFASRSAAAVVRNQIGRLEYIVAPLQAMAVGH
ncbi:MAG: SPOR domain-containing protein [Phycisphaerales bacterium]|nr:MAG: SPOR domain-containing protein [Phycisphaerales bacterium]